MGEWPWSTEKSPPGSPRAADRRRANAGVAAARNAGAAATAAAYLAFIDADDLWGADRDRVPARRTQSGRPGGRPGLCWFASIDQHDRVVSFGPQPPDQGAAMKGTYARQLDRQRLLAADAPFRLREGRRLRSDAEGAPGAGRGGSPDVLPRRRRAFAAWPSCTASRGLSRDAGQHLEQLGSGCVRSTELVLTMLADDPSMPPAWASICGPRATGSPIMQPSDACRRDDARILLAEALRRHPLASAWHFSGLALSIARGRLQRRLVRRKPFAAAPPKSSGEERRNAFST